MIDHMIIGFFSCWLSAQGEYLTVLRLEPIKNTNVSSEFLYSTIYSSKVEVIDYDVSKGTRICKLRDK